MKRGNVDIVTMGCSKNLVDSEVLFNQFLQNGLQVDHNPSKHHNGTVVINTCGFIGDAKEESINMILDFVKEKEEGRIKELVVMGCLSERYREDLMKEIPEIDRIYGKFDWKNLIKDMKLDHKTTFDPLNRLVTTPKHYAYIKVSEGCNRTCSFCAIPLMTGKHKSRSKDEIVAEVTALVASGVKEFQIIAQDLSSYGTDLYKSHELPSLVEAISDIPGVEWIRLHYFYPARFPEDILRVIRERDNVCNYIDIALQHISDNMLTKMRRNFNKERTYELIEKMRAEVPGLHIRTTLLTGHPGETEEDFNELLEFVDTIKFERMGAFAYSEEDDTWSAKLYEDDIPAEVKEQRVDAIMNRQQDIAFAHNEQKVGQTFKVVIDSEDKDYFIGRTEFDSPEVDPEVLVTKADGVAIGDFVQVKITGTEGYDLIGEVQG